MASKKPRGIQTEKQDKQAILSDSGVTKDSGSDENKDPYAEYAGALDQIKKEYQYALGFMEPRWRKMLIRLKLYNNQKRKDDAIGDPLLFTIMQTVIASLYADQLTVDFQGRNRGDDEQAECLVALAKNDSVEMEKDKLDYAWIWNTCFAGAALVLMDMFDVETKTPIPEAIDPFTFLRDPDATSVNGNRKGKGAARFLGREITLTKLQLKEKGEMYKNIDKLPEIGDDSKLTPVQTNLRTKQEIAGYQVLKQGLTGDNAAYICLEWWTWWNGKKYCFTVGSNFGTILRVREVKTKGWPFVKRQLYPTADDWDGVSIPDLVEDKQRGRAKLLNLALKSEESGLYPSYLFNSGLIKNKAQLSKIAFNKYIGVNGNPAGAIVPVERRQVGGDVGWMLASMDGAAQKATATPDIQQGAMSEKVKSATEVAKVSQGVDTRYSLAAKQLGISEKEFWKLWYENYDLYLAASGVDKKVLRIMGPLGPQWREIERDNIIGKADPDIIVTSKMISDASRTNRVNMLMAFTNQAVAMDPNTNRRWLLKEIGKAMSFSTEEVNRALPQTSDEYEAEQENELINKGILPKISITQNHMVHREIHTKAIDNKTRAAHIKMHEAALFMQKENPALVKQPNMTIGPDGKPVPAQNPGEQAPPPMATGQAPSPRAMAQDQVQVQSSAPTNSR